MDSMIVKVLLPVCIDVLLDYRMVSRNVCCPVNWGLVGLTLPGEACPNPADGVLLPFDKMAESEEWWDTARRICKEFANASIQPEHFVLRYMSLRRGCALVLAPFCVPKSEDLEHIAQPCIDMESQPARIYSGFRVVSQFETDKWLLSGDAYLAATLFREDCPHNSRGWFAPFSVRHEEPIILGQPPGWQARNQLVSLRAAVPERRPYGSSGKAAVARANVLWRRRSQLENEQRNVARAPKHCSKCGSADHDARTHRFYVEDKP